MAKKPTYEELEGKVQFYEKAIGEARKQIMKALRDNKLWNPEFHQQELLVEQSNHMVRYLAVLDHRISCF